jgi:hypothetical protein
MAEIPLWGRKMVVFKVTRPSVFAVGVVTLLYLQGSVSLAQDVQSNGLRHSIASKAKKPATIPGTIQPGTIPGTQPPGTINNFVPDLVGRIQEMFTTMKRN